MGKYRDEKVCQWCGQLFIPTDDRPSRPATYCSRSCSGASRSTSVELKCVQCGETFRRRFYMKDWSTERGPFCGFRCYGEWQSEHMLGEANPFYKEHSNCKIAGEFTRNRLKVLDRDSYACRICGKNEDLHVHHIEKWSEDSIDPHRVDNLITLCSSCHKKQHPVPKLPNGKFYSPKNQEDLEILIA